VPRIGLVERIDFKVLILSGMYRSIFMCYVHKYFQVFCCLYIITLFFSFLLIFFFWEGRWSFNVLFHKTLLSPSDM